MSDAGTPAANQPQGTIAVDNVRNQMLAQIAKYLAQLVTPTPGGGSLTLNTRTTSASTTVTATDYAIRCDATTGALIITLPAIVSSNGRILAFKKIDGSTNAVTIQGDALIDNAATYSLNFGSQAVEIQGNGVTWDIY